MITRRVSTNNGRISNENLRRLITTATTFLLTFLRKFGRNLNNLTHYNGIISMLRLSKIRATQVLRVRGISSIRLRTVKRLTILNVLILRMVVMRFNNRDKGLVIMRRRNGTLLTILPSGQLSSKRNLAEAEDARGPYTARQVSSIRPSLTRLTLMVVTRESIRTMLILLRLPTLLGTLVLRIRTIFRRPFLRRLESVIRNSVRRCSASSKDRRVRPDIRARNVRAKRCQVARRPCKLRGRRRSQRRQVRRLPTDIGLRVLLITHSRANSACRRRHDRLTVRRITIVMGRPPLSTDISVHRCTTRRIRLLQLRYMNRRLRRSKSVGRHPRCLMGALWLFTFFRLLCSSIK